MNTTSEAVRFGRFLAGLGERFMAEGHAVDLYCDAASEAVEGTVDGARLVVEAAGCGYDEAVARTATAVAVAIAGGGRAAGGRPPAGRAPRNMGGGGGGMKSIRGSFPYPVDVERQERCRAVLLRAGMTMTELAEYMGWNKSYASNLIAGRSLSVSNERRVAEFFGLPVDYLFPLRTPLEIAAMREREAAERERVRRLRSGRIPGGAA